MTDHPDTDLTDPHGEVAQLRRDLALARECIANLEGEQERAEMVEAAPDWTKTARYMIEVWDTWFGGAAPDLHEDAHRLLTAAMFAGQQFDDLSASPMTADAAAGGLLRAFLLALIDPMNAELDHLRACNRGPAAPEADDLVSRAVHPDDAAVDRFAAAMKVKMAKGRLKGRAAWDDKDACTDQHLADMLMGHIPKGNAGNFEDIANLVMMLHQRGADPAILSTTLPAAQVAQEPVAWESISAAYRRFVSDKTYRGFGAEAKRWYRPYRCSSCATPHREGGA